MMELARHIEQLLLENDCVIVPGLGGFVTHYSSSVRIEEENLFLPPVRTIGFNPRLRLNDGMLAQAYMVTYATDFPDATRRLNKDVEALVRQLHEEGTARLENIGELRCDIHGNYLFTPEDNRMVTPSLYGLDAFEMRKLSTRKKSLLIRSHTRKEAKTPIIIRTAGRALLRYAAALVIGIVVFFGFTTPVENTRIQRADYLRLLPGELFGSIGQQSVVITPVKTKPVESRQDQTGAKTVKTTDKDSGKVVLIPDRPVRRPSAIKETTVPRPETTPSAPEIQTPKTKTDTQSPRHHIIVLAGVGKQTAENYVAQLIAEGYPHARILPSGTLIRVSLESFDDRRSATQRMTELRKKPGFKNAWLFTK